MCKSYKKSAVSSRQPDNKGSAAVFCITQLDAAAMDMNRFPGDGQSQAEMVFPAAGRIAAIEAFKDGFLLRIGNAA